MRFLFNKFFSFFIFPYWYFKFLFDKLKGRKIIMFNICNENQIQFISPIYFEFLKRKANYSFYLSCDYKLKSSKEMQLSKSHIGLSLNFKYQNLIDVYIQTEIYARGPKKAEKIFVGHGQPNKISFWSADNLNSFDHYFFYGELEKEMFQEIINQNKIATSHLKYYDIGYPKLDDQINSSYNKDDIFQKLGLNPVLKTVIYSPAWDPGGSLRKVGLQLVKELIDIQNINVLVKLHPASMVSKLSNHYAFYTGGKDWMQEFAIFNKFENFKFITDDVINPYLFISDIMITDFSGVALEFITMDKPVVYFHCPEFYELTLKQWNCDADLAINDIRFNAGRNAGIVIYNLDEVKTAVTESLAFPKELSNLRKKIACKLLYNPGQGSKATVDTIIQLLNK